MSKHQQLNASSPFRDGLWVTKNERSSCKCGASTHNFWHGEVSYYECFECARTRITVERENYARLEKDVHSRFNKGVS